MAILKRNKAGKENNLASGNNGEETNVPKKGKKRLSYMADVFDESVPGAVLETFIENKNFMYTNNDERQFMAFALDTESIGGISKKTIKDKAKGGFINLIKSSTIKIYMTEELADEGILLFIPTDETIIGMSEYSILANAEYTLVTLDDTLDITYHDSQLLDFESFDIKDGRLPFDNARRNSMLDQFGITYDGSFEYEEEIDEEDDIDTAVGFNDEDLYEEESEYEFDSSPSIDEFADELDDVYASTDFDMVDDDETPYELDENGELVAVGGDVYADESEIVKSENELIYDDDRFDEVVFNFSEDGLKIEVDPTNFELTYGKSLLKYDPFDTSRDEGRWINDYLNEVSVESNNTLRHESRNNYSVLKSSYLRIMGESVQYIKMKASTSGDTEFAEEFAEINASYEDLLNETDGKIEHSINLEKKRYEAELEDIGEAAKQEAIRSHKAMHDGIQARKLDKIREDLIYDAGEVRARRLKELDAKRQVFVNEQIAKAAATTITNLNGVYLQMKNSENELVERLNDKLEHYAQTHQVADERIYNTRRLEIESKAEISTIKQQHTADINKIKAEFESLILANRQQHEANIKVLESQYVNDAKLKDGKIESLSTELEREQNEVSTLIKAVESVKAQKDEEYQSRVANAEERANYANKKLDDEVRYARSKQFILFGIVLLVALVAALAGVTIGNSNGRASAMAEMNASNNNGGNNVYLPIGAYAGNSQNDTDDVQESTDTSDQSSEVSSETPSETTSEES